MGNHYEVANGAATKYYYAGSQQIAMRTNGTLNFLVSTGSTQRLGDHLGSTSLTTDATGNVVSEMRYKAWGEVRYASGASPTDYTYTGQFYTADFGLMFYNARWYDSSLSRFVQADTVMPGGVQGLDRYAYANNSPIVYTDPSGHKPCDDELGCAVSGGTGGNSGGGNPDPVVLTNPGDSVPGTGGTQSFGGTQVKQLYDLMVGCTACWWYKNGSFTIETFLGLIVMAEANYLQGDSDAMDAIKQIYAQRLYVGGGSGNTEPYCPSGQCYNGVFNYLAATSGSVWKMINTFVIGKANISKYMGPASIGQYDGQNDQKIQGALYKSVSLGYYALHPSRLYERKEGPSEYGPIGGALLSELRTNNIPTNQINGIASNTFYLYFSDDVYTAAYFSIDQKNFWLGEMDK